MFKLMDKVDDGVVPMLQDLQTFIKDSGTADMHACAKTIVTVGCTIYCCYLVVVNPLMCRSDLIYLMF